MKRSRTDLKGCLHQQHPQIRIQNAGQECCVKSCLSWVQKKKTHDSRVPRLYQHTPMYSCLGVCVENVRADLQTCRGTHPQACVCSRKSANSNANSHQCYHQRHQQSVIEGRREDVHWLLCDWIVLCTFQNGCRCWESSISTVGWPCHLVRLIWSA